MHSGKLPSGAAGRPRQRGRSGRNSRAEQAAATTPDALAARTLGDFIRAHRERLAPEAVGLGAGGRRRTPGLRREEVAQLCGFSPTWYTWIEQGRPVSPSAAALSRIASALRLTRAERAYLFELAAQRDPEAAGGVTSDVPRALLASVELLATPAYVLDRQWNALAWNTLASALFIGWLDAAGEGQRNLLRYMFTSEAARSLVVDWETRARRVVAEFRADTIRHLQEAPTAALVDALLATSADFGAFWHSHDVGGRDGGLREFLHPVQGRLVYDQLTLRPSSRDDLKLVVLGPVQA
jgi:transcriptional regulator with XRE-family HTH domain